jgi:uncharacterized protein (TIGR00369 family)
MAELNPAHVQAVIQAINQGPYIRHLAMTVREMGPGFAAVELAVGREHLNPFGGIHGGAYASLIDTAAYWAAYSEIEAGVGLISIDLKIDYLAPLSQGVILSRGRSIKIGKTMCLAEAAATDADGKWLAHGTSKMMITRGLQSIEDAFRFTGSATLPPKFL